MPRPITSSAPVKSAWRKGFSAGKRGLSQDANPYRQAGEGPLVGWTRLYHDTWLVGWQDGQAETNSVRTWNE